MKIKAKKSMVMNSHCIDVIVDDDRWLVDDLKDFANIVFGKTLGYVQENNLNNGIGFEKPIRVCLCLNDDCEVQKLNAEFRGKDKPTNVLSFANIDDDDFVSSLSFEVEVELGDIIMAFETVKAESEQKGILLKDHFAHLLVHGLLHLFGYDHQDDDEADEMEGYEIKILELLGIANPYID